MVDCAGVREGLCKTQSQILPAVCWAGLVAGSASGSLNSDLFGAFWSQDSHPCLSAERRVGGAATSGAGRWREHVR
jgi:hypothetical protein